MSQPSASRMSQTAAMAPLGRLLADLARQNGALPLDLLAPYEDLLGLVAASGVALVQDGQARAVGRVPPQAELPRLAALLPPPQAEPLAFDVLQAVHPWAAAFAAEACGLLGLRLPDRRASCLLWFRAAPRAAPWLPADIAMARELGQALTGLMLRRAEALASLAEELARSNRELEAFAYSVSHDLRAPFRHVVGFAHLLRARLDGQMDATAARYLATIIDAGAAAGRLVDDLLAFSQLGRTRLTLTPVAMAPMVDEVVRTLELELAGRQVEWRIAALPPAWGDGAMLRQVLLNLLSNAVKYTRRRDMAVIDIGAHCLPAETIYSVCDNGIGFDMAAAGKLFGVFQRLHRAEEYEGTGIGLALVQRIIERHGGRLWAESAPDRGASFFFALPNGPDGT